MVDADAIRQRWEAVGSKLDERGRRLFAAAEARTAGWGGLAMVSKITSGLIQLKQRVEMLEFDTGIFGCEVPIGFDVMAIAVVLPGGDFLDEGLFVGNAAVKALGR